MSQTYVIELSDATGSLERLLNKCRRKAHWPQTLAVGPGGPGTLRVVITLPDTSAAPSRVAADLAKVHDVRAVEHRVDPQLVAALDAVLDASQLIT